jgi:hypothetical protein
MPPALPLLAGTSRADYPLGVLVKQLDHLGKPGRETRRVGGLGVEIDFTVRPEAERDVVKVGVFHVPLHVRRKDRGKKAPFLIRAAPISVLSVFKHLAIGAVAKSVQWSFWAIFIIM